MKKNDAIFLKYSLILSLVVLLIAFYPVYVYASKIQVYSIITGYLISLFNIIIGYSLNRSALNKNVKSFMVIVFGSMTLRLVIVAIFLVILLTYTQLDSIYLVSSVFFFYFLFVSLEIYFLTKKPGNTTATGNNTV